MFPTTFSTRLSLLVGTLAAAGIALLAFVLIRGHWDFVVREAAHFCDNVAETIRLGITLHMLENDPEGVREVIEAIGQHEGLDRVRLFNKEGEVRYSSEPSEVGRIVDKGAEACTECHEADQPLRHVEDEKRFRTYALEDGTRMLSVIRVIPNEHRCASAACHAKPSEVSVLGVLDVGVSMEPTRRRLLDATRQGGVLAAVTVLATAVILFLITRDSVDRPIRRLVAATRKVARGEFDGKVSSDGRDDLAFLARSFNEMVESLQDSQARLDEGIATLEEKLRDKASQLREARHQAVQAEKLSAAGIVAAGVAHELNSPLMGIITFANLVQRTLSPESQSYEDLNTVVAEANRCATIVRSLLDFSRQHDEDAPRERCDPAELLRRALRLVEPKLKEHEIRQRVEIQENLPPVAANAVQIVQVLVNLFLNAWHAMEGGGTLTVAADEVDAKLYPALEFPGGRRARIVRIRVRDTGCGISPEQIDKIFEPFFTTKPVGQGSGLGLSVSHGIVARHGGHILVKSDGRTGAEFTILLPGAPQTEEMRETEVV